MSGYLDDRTVYVFVRQDLPLAQQLVQSNHAVFGLTHFGVVEDGAPNIVVVGVPDLKALERVLAKLKREQIIHVAWREPDLELGFTAIATVPLNKAQKLPLANYRLWRHSPCWQQPSPSVALASPLGGEPSRLSSEKEHSVSDSSREVTGSIPVVGSSLCVPCE